MKPAKYILPIIVFSQFCCTSLWFATNGVIEDLVTNFNLDMVNSKGYSFFMETIYLLSKLGHNIYEIPIQFKNRTQGQSKIPKLEVLRTLKNLLIIFLKK